MGCAVKNRPTVQGKGKSPVVPECQQRSAHPDPAAKIGIDLTAQQVVDKEMKPVAPSSHPEPLDTHEAHHLAALAKLLDYYYSTSNQLFDLG